MLAQLSRQWIQKGDRVLVTFGTLEQWRQQAEAIGRSQTHLESIELIIQLARDEIERSGSALPSCEIDLEAYRAMRRDQTKFNELAFRLIREKQQQSDSSNNGDGSLFSGFLDFWNGNHNGENES